MLPVSSSQPQQWLKLENNSERATHFLADLFAVIIKLNWDGNVMFALLSKIISSLMAIMAIVIEWCWKYFVYRVSYLMSVCLLIFLSLQCVFPFF